MDGVFCCFRFAAVTRAGSEQVSLSPARGQKACRATVPPHKQGPNSSRGLLL